MLYLLFCVQSREIQKKPTGAGVVREQSRKFVINARAHYYYGEIRACRLNIGVGRLRILGGGPRFRILGGGGAGGQIPSRHMTS